MHSTIRTNLAKPTISSNQDACLVFIYPTGTDIGKRYLLTEKTLVLGRDADCEIWIDDTAVSRRHARLEMHSEGFYAEDLGSTNGTFINDRPIKRALLRDGDYLRVGRCIYRFLSGGNVEAEYHQVIYQLTIYDPLTETFNRRYLLEFLERELVRSSRHKRPLSVVMMDLDHFKSINDTQGHLCGDAILREFSSRIKKTVRRDELFARYGGEEFVLILPETNKEGAEVVAERMRKLIGELPFEFEGQSLPITVSLGISITNGDEKYTPNQILQLADEKLYQAKKKGRNRVAS